MATNLRKGTGQVSTENPFGLHTVTPYLVIDDVRSVIEFAESIVGAKLRGDLMMRDDGSVGHVEVSIGDSVVMMGEPMEGWSTTPGMLYVYVDDCDARHALALESGATEVIAPTDYPHGDRYGIVRDGSGNMWCLVTHKGASSV